MSKKFLVFDLDGTLLYTLPSILKELNKTLAPLGKGEISLEECRRFIGNGSDKLVFRSLDRLGLGDLDSEKKKEIVRVYNKAYLDHPIEGTEPYPGITELLKERKALGDSLAVFSNKPDSICHPIIDHFFPKGTFDIVRGSREDTPRKPDPEGLFKMMDKAGFHKDDTYYIGDGDADILLGKKAGVKTLLVSYGYRDRDLLEKSGFPIFDSVKELSDFIKKS